MEACHGVKAVTLVGQVVHLSLSTQGNSMDCLLLRVAEEGRKVMTNKILMAVMLVLIITGLGYIQPTVQKVD